MQARQPIQAGHSGVQRRAGRLSVARLTAAFLVAGTAGCGPLEAPDRALELASQSQALDSTNGLSMNGLSMNGLSVNGLPTQGLSTIGLNSPSFSSWFESNPTLHDVVMSYLVLCAVRAGEPRIHIAPSTGQLYLWKGQFGLAPGWASGSPATVAEQQLVSACLAAHANRNGLHVPISVLGRGADQQDIPYTTSELEGFRRREACFFGNLFTPEGLFVGVDSSPSNGSEGSTTRTCGATPSSDSSLPCPPFTHIGSCQELCQPAPAAPFHGSCTYNGMTYLPITTRLRPKDFFSHFAP